MTSHPDTDETVLTLSVCTDCAHLHANGETPERFSEAETEAWLADIELRLDGLRTLGLGEDLGFSWDRCDGCDSRLGGDRIELAALILR